MDQDEAFQTRESPLLSLQVSAPPSLAREMALASGDPLRSGMSSHAMARQHEPTDAPESSFQSMSDVSASDPANRQYRGFGSSISHFFAKDNSEGLDACSIACCGVLQADQNRFLLTGETPPTFLMRFLKHLLIPIVLLLLLWSCAYSKMPLSELANGAILVTSAIMLGFLVLFHTIRQTRLRKFLRKEMLWRKYHQTGADVFPRPKGFGEDLQNEEERYQTDHDIDCATAVIGCYKKDTPLLGYDEQLSHNAFARGRKCASMLCCGFAGYYLQLCGMCAIAQEGRDIERLVPKSLRRFDYQTMQPALEYYSQILTLRQQQHGKARFKEHLMAISYLSRQLLQLLVFGFVVATVVLLFGGFSWKEVAILVAVLTYSWLLTYLVHWPFNGLHISIDAVIKCFACGFMIASSMALAWETFVGLILQGVMDLTMLALGAGRVGDGNGMAHDAYEGSYYGQSMSYYKLFLGQFGQDYPWMYVTYLFVHAFLVSALTEEIVKYLSYQMMTDHPDFWTKDELAKTVEVAKETEDPALNVQDFPPVELQDRSKKTKCKIIMVAMVVVALGFMCAENLLYIFVYNASHVKAQHFGLLARFLLPIHPICAAWQAIGVCRREVEGDDMIQIGRILGPVIVFHGGFDFVVMLADFLVERSGNAIFGRIAGFIAAAIIAIAGTVRVYWKFKNLQSRIGWFVMVDTVAPTTDRLT
jgi:Flp pilus assembly pilin Flp